MDVWGNLDVVDADGCSSGFKDASGTPALRDVPSLQHRQPAAFHGYHHPTEGSGPDCWRRKGILPGMGQSGPLHLQEKEPQGGTGNAGADAQLRTGSRQQVRHLQRHIGKHHRVELTWIERPVRRGVLGRHRLRTPPLPRGKCRIRLLGTGATLLQPAAIREGDGYGQEGAERTKHQRHPSPERTRLHLFGLFSHAR